MKMYPPHINHNDFIISKRKISSAEEKIYRALRDDVKRKDYYGFHSLNLTNHQYKLIAEIDFVVLCPEGLYCLEVKGGPVELKDGLWYYAYGSSKEGPFKQVSSAMFTLKEELQSRFSWDFDFSHLTIGYGVIFTDCIFNENSVEWDREYILDVKDIYGKSDYMKLYLDRMVSYWRSKRSGITLESENIQSVIRRLRPSFEIVKALRATVEEADAGFVKLTEEQFHALDYSETADKIIYEGGAGTGKTLLALECARRHAAEGQKVLVLYFNPLLSTFLNSQINSSLIVVKSIHQWMSEVAGESKRFSPVPDPEQLKEELYTTTLPSAVIDRYSQDPNTPKYDVLIVDEAQDVISINYLMCLDLCLKQGLTKGKWRFFMDPKYQSTVTGAFEESALKELHSLKPHFVPLTRNCRNTSEIIRHTKLWTGIEFCKDSKVPGPDISVIYYSDHEQHRRKVLEILSDMKEGIMHPGDITFLSDKTYEESIIADSLIQKQYKVRLLDRYNIPSFPFDELTFSSIEDFKGFENRVIVICDLSLADFEAIKNKLYVALTRSRFKLIILLPNNVMEKVMDQVAKNSNLKVKMHA